MIANDIATDPRSSKRMPAGHPPLTNFLGLPLTRGSETLGSIGLANRDGGYDQDLVDELHPVIGVCAQLIAAWRNRRARREAQRELRERERELDCILENIPLMVCVKDAATGQFIRFNRAGEQLLGISREALIGRGDYTLLPKAQADFFASCDRQALAKGLPLDIPEQPLVRMRAYAPCTRARCVSSTMSASRDFCWVSPRTSVNAKATSIPCGSTSAWSPRFRINWR